MRYLFTGIVAAFATFSAFALEGGADVLDLPVPAFGNMANTTLRELANDARVILVMNVAAESGMAYPNLMGVQDLQSEFADEMEFAIVGFPCADFHHNIVVESWESIADIIESRYGIDIILGGGVHIEDPEKRHPLFDYLLHAQPEWKPEEVMWNFQKYILVDGHAVERFAPIDFPNTLSHSIDKALDSIDGGTRSVHEPEQSDIIIRNVGAVDGVLASGGLESEL